MIGSGGAPEPAPTGFDRHIAACNNAPLPDGRARLLHRDRVIGWIAPGLLPALRAFGVEPSADGDVVLDDPARLQPAAEHLAALGALRLRHEAFDILPGRGEPSLGTIDRGALPCFGLVAGGVHVNGLVRTGAGLAVWAGRRAAHKQLDPGKLDQLIGGGIAAGHDPEQTLLKEGAEECSLPPELGRRAVKVAELTYRMQRPEGLRRDVLHCFDLMLPEGWTPTPNDGEVEHFRLLPIEEVAAMVLRTDEFKFNVNLVLIDLFLRLGLIDPASEEGHRLRAGLHAPL